jgi:hypothetical protein
MDDWGVYHRDSGVNGDTGASRRIALEPREARVVQARLRMQAITRYCTACILNLA